MMAPRSTDPQQQMMNQMMQFMPIMFIFFAFSVPAGLVLYWVTTNLFTFAQQYFMTGWGSLSMPKSFSIAALASSFLGTKPAEAEPKRSGKSASSSVLAAQPSSNGAKTAPESARTVEEAIDQAKGQGNNKKRRKRR
jgi:YidC/Oxa1 family membrane protein insertase